MQLIPTKRFKADTDFYIRKKKFLKIVTPNDKQIELMIKNLAEEEKPKEK